MKSYGKTYRTLLIIVITLTTSSAFSQYVNLTKERDNVESKSTQFKPNYSLELNTGFVNYGFGYSTFGTTIMPKISMPISDRISLFAGIGYSTMFMGQSALFSNTPMSYGHVFAGADYKLNEKVTLRGAAYSTFNIISQPVDNEQNPTPNFESKGVAVDVEYKVTENFRINVGFQYRKQNVPNYLNPFNPYNRNSMTQDVFNPGMPFQTFGY